MRFASIHHQNAVPEPCQVPPDLAGFERAVLWGGWQGREGERGGKGWRDKGEGSNSEQGRGLAKAGPG